MIREDWPRHQKKRILIVLCAALIGVGLFPATGMAVTMGDLLDTGTVTVSDALLALRISVGLVTASPYQLSAGDVNGDGSITVSDALLILREVVGIGPTVSGTASQGSALPEGTLVTLTDVNGNTAAATVGTNGSYTCQVTGLTAPYLLNAGGLYSLASASGITDINPLTNLCMQLALGTSTISSGTTFPANFQAQFGTVASNVKAALNGLYPATVPSTQTDFLHGAITIGAGVDAVFGALTISAPDTSGTFSASVGSQRIFYGTLAGNIVTITPDAAAIAASSAVIFPIPTLISVAVTPSNPTLAVGVSQQFSAVGTFSDQTTQDLTAAATWSSSFPSVAAISTSAGSFGLATPVATGTTTITATVPVTRPVQGSVSGSTTLAVTGGSAAPANVLPITVNGSLCSSATSGGYFNKPCVSVTVCNPDGSNCQVINDILLDTGSYGLRIFKQALSNVSLTQVTVASGALAECVEYADGTSDWGPVQMAAVVLGNEPAVQVPIQVIDSTFGTRSRGCRQADTSAVNAGFTGILGVGLFAQDCGDTCTSSTNNGNYYSCGGSLCSGTAVPPASQVTNPVALLPLDNNGVLVQLQSVPLGGVTSVNGSLILGIGTRSNNAPAGVTAYPANSAAEFTTTFNGISSDSSFIDSGSNGLYFPAPASLLPDCGGSNTGYYCPATTLSLSATDTGAFGSPSGTVPFYQGNFNSLIDTSNNVFSEVGGSEVGGFDWGLPFFFGRNVFLGFDSTSSGLGTGPCWAY